MTFSTDDRTSFLLIHAVNIRKAITDDGPKNDHSRIRYIIKTMLRFIHPVTSNVGAYTSHPPIVDVAHF